MIKRHSACVCVGGIKLSSLHMNKADLGRAISLDFFQGALPEFADSPGLGIILLNGPKVGEALSQCL